MKMKIEKGIINLVLTKEQREAIKNGELDAKNLQLEDTIQSFMRKDGTKVEFLKIRLSKNDIDSNGNQKYIKNEKTQEMDKVYKFTDIITLFDKEMRIALDIGKYNPVKIVAKEEINGSYTNLTAVAIQDQSMGIKQEVQEKKQTNDIKQKQKISDIQM